MKKLEESYKANRTGERINLNLAYSLKNLKM